MRERSLLYFDGFHVSISSLRIFFFSLVSSTVSIPNAGHSDCSRDCVPQYTAWDDSALLVLCCDSHDMCNDVGASVDEYIASIQQNSSE